MENTLQPESRISLLLELVSNAEHHGFMERLVNIHSQYFPAFGPGFFQFKRIFRVKPARSHPHHGLPLSFDGTVYFLMAKEIKGFTQSIDSFYQRPARAITCGGENGYRSSFHLTVGHSHDHDRTSRAPVALVSLNALKTAQENHNITSETGLRHYLLEWLSGASRHPEFRSLLAKSWR